MKAFFYGNDSYRLRQAVHTAVADMRTADSCVVISVDGSEERATQYLQEAEQTPDLFGDRRLIVLGNAACVPNSARFMKQAQTDILFWQMTDGLGAAGKRTTETLAKAATNVRHLDVLKGKERMAWIGSFCAERGKNIRPDAIRELDHRVSQDTWQLAQELEKLCAYTERTIDAAAVCALVPLPDTYDEWEFSNALAAREKRAALRALWRRLRGGIAEQQLLGLLASAVRTLVMVHDGVGRGLPAADIAKRSGLHPFVVKKNLASARAADGAALRALHMRIARIDRDAKRGRADLLDGLFDAIVSMP